MADVFLSLGSNIGNLGANLADAVRRLRAEPGVTVVAVSALYRTKPVGPVAQDYFVNGAVRVETTLEPEDLMRRCLAIEAGMGRDRANSPRWGPRLIDIDIILYGDLTLKTEMVEVPHPRFAERAFVLVPLAELAPDHRVGDRTLAQLADAVDRAGVERAD
ncbi:MAG: 2-amino-4-hydroxy-6-hydroxymethyldihydropteridine diphosphokinase [Hyphomicrobiales bacterium]